MLLLNLQFPLAVQRSFTSTSTMRKLTCLNSHTTLDGGVESWCLFFGRATFSVARTDFGKSTCAIKKLLKKYLCNFSKCPCKISNILPVKFYNVQFFWKSEKISVNFLLSLPVQFVPFFR